MDFENVCKDLEKSFSDYAHLVARKNELLDECTTEIFDLRAERDTLNAAVDGWRLAAIVGGCAAVIELGVIFMGGA